jgi:uncharacterized protein
MAKYVNSPDAFSPLFSQAEDILTPIFWDFKRMPEQGAITISSERYIMYRGDSMAIALKDQLTSVLGKGAGVVIYQIGKATGSADARFYFEKTGIADPAMRLAMGPVAFAFGGYANVTILEDSAPAPTEDFLLVYDHPNSYESEAHIAAGLKADAPVDFLNAGYSAGWCSEAFGLKLEAKEITCKAMGQENCRFVMAPGNRLRERVAEIKARYGI